MSKFFEELKNTFYGRETKIAYGDLIESVSYAYDVTKGNIIRGIGKVIEAAHRDGEAVSESPAKEYADTTVDKKASEPVKAVIPEPKSAEDSPVDDDEVSRARMEYEAYIMRLRKLAGLPSQEVKEEAPVPEEKAVFSELVEVVEPEKTLKPDAIDYAEVYKHHLNNFLKKNIH